MINLKQELLNREGKVSTAKVPVTEQVEKDGEMVEEQRLEEKVVTLGSMLEHACLKNDGARDEETVSKRFALYEKLNGQDEIELDDEDLKTLRGLVCEAFDTFFAGSILNLLK